MDPSKHLITPVTVTAVFHVISDGSRARIELRLLSAESEPKGIGCGETKICVAPALPGQLRNVAELRFK